MNLSFAFFHGEQALVGAIFAAGIALLGFPALLYIWLWHTKVSELKLALGFLIAMVVACGLVAFNSPDSTFILVFAAFFIAFIFTLPWNVITLSALYVAGTSDVSDGEFAVVMLLGASINTMLLYLAAKKVRSLIK